jgi:ATP-binding cassette subfamily F protein 3
MRRTYRDCRPTVPGKSTLFRLILGVGIPTSAMSSSRQSARIGYIRQHLKATSDTETLIEYAAARDSRLAEMEQELQAVGRLWRPGWRDAARVLLLERLGEVQTAFEHLGGYENELASKVSLGAGFASRSFEKPFAIFSGGCRCARSFRGTGLKPISCCWTTFQLSGCGGCGVAAALLARA